MSGQLFPPPTPWKFFHPLQSNTTLTFKVNISESEKPKQRSKIFSSLGHEFLKMKIEKKQIIGLLHLAGVQNKLVRANILFVHISSEAQTIYTPLNRISVFKGTEQKLRTSEASVVQHHLTYCELYTNGLNTDQTYKVYASTCMQHLLH